MMEHPVRALLVEDNPGDARLIELMLTQSTSPRFELVHVVRLGDALAFLQSSYFDVLLLDLSLPDSHGFDTFTRIKGKANALPIILLTGLDDEVVALKAVREGAQDYLIKGDLEVNLLIRSVRYAIERKRAEEHVKASLREKEVMLQEIHHRVKNNLQIISSLLSLQSRTIKDKYVLEILRDCQNRVHSMALVHGTLYRSENLARINFSKYTQSLANDLCDSYGAGARAISLEIHVDDVSLGIDTAGPVGLILNELVSNCLKHAFPNGRPGKIRIEFHANSDNQYTLTVSDNGVGLPQDLNSGTTQSLGLRLVNVLTQQLEGRLGVNGKNGTCFSITFAEPA
jgi:two-component sensor histidine kinase